MKYVCEICGQIYDEEAGYPIRKIEPGTPFADLPEDFSCPGCGSEKEAFSLPRKNQSVSVSQDIRSDQYHKYPDQHGESDR